MKSHAIFSPFIVAFSLLPSATARAQSSLQADLATEIMRSAQAVAATEPVTMASLEGALLLAEEALTLDDRNEQHWRTALELASLAENEDLRTRALERLGELAPADESIRLMRLNAALERYQTVEERIARYETLLAEDNVGRLGPALASRLATDLALLHRRQGNNQEFARWLSQALALDSANRSAAAMAAGFFRMNVSDAFGQAELLTNLMLADPTDVNTQVALAQQLLENGAYQAADRIYGLAVNSLRANEQFPSNDLLADRAVAQWARGDAATALETLRQRQADLDAQYRILLARQQPNLPATELATHVAPVDPTHATVRAAIEAGLKRSNAEHRQALVATVLEAYRSAIERISTAENPDQAQLARLHLEMAWVTLWLGADAESAGPLLEAAEQHQPLSEQARQRFDGWVALRRGEPERAIELLAPLADEDSTAALGLAMALVEQGQNKEAARQFLTVARAQPGSVIGVWAAERLTALLGKRVPLSADAQKMERLISSIPQILDRYPQDGSLAVGLRLVPADNEFGPFEPFMFGLEIANNSIYPLAIDREGPIRPQVVVATTVRSATASNFGDLPPFVVNIGRRLRLAPRERLVIPLDLRHFVPGERLNDEAADGAIIRLRAQINFHALPNGTLKAGLYGVEVEAPLVRLQGVRATPDWRNQALAALRDPGPAESVRTMALLSHSLAPRLDATVLLEERKAIEAARTAFAEAFAQLDALSQAWLLAVMARGEGLQPVLSIAQKSEDRLVRLVYLLFYTRGRNDPMLDAARRSEDPVLRRFGELLGPTLPATTQPGATPPPATTRPEPLPVVSPPMPPPATTPANAPTAPTTQPTTAPGP